MFFAYCVSFPVGGDGVEAARVYEAEAGPRDSVMFSRPAYACRYIGDVADGRVLVDRGIVGYVAGSLSAAFE